MLASKIIGRIQFLAAVELKFPFSCWLSVEGNSQFLKTVFWSSSGGSAVNEPISTH